MEELDIRIGKKLKSLREKKNLSMREVASRVDINFTYLSHIEKGKMPSLEKLKMLCNLYGISIQELFSEGKEMEVPKKLKDLGVEWIAHVDKMKGKNLTPEEVEKMVDIVTKLKEL